ncbi:hypothetical protein MKW92_048612, partial [Papaver armeniacum]
RSLRTQKFEAHALLPGIIAKLEKELVPLRMKDKENQANQQRLVVEIAFAASNANLTNDAIAEIAIATSNANLTKDVIAAKEKLLRQRREELS